MSKKTIVAVELLCSKCMMRVMKSVAKLEGITSVALDPSKNTLTVIGEADPVSIVKKVRKCRKSAYIISFEPPKDEKKDVSLQTLKTCQKCDAEIESRHSRELTSLPACAKSPAKEPLTHSAFGQEMSSISDPGSAFDVSSLLCNYLKEIRATRYKAKPFSDINRNHRNLSTSKNTLHQLLTSSKFATVFASNNLGGA